MRIVEETKMIMKKYNLDFKKKFGQNFLISEDVLDEILVNADVTNEDIILEIGPGIGTLTSKLLETAKHVISVEIDNELIPALKGRFFMYKNFTLINEDILKINLREELNKIVEKYGKKGQKVKVVANIPYYITTPIILELIDKRDIIDTVHIMVQKEVSERLKAELGTKNAGSITYLTNYYAEVINIIDVPKQNFMPAPKVDSEVIGLRVREIPYPEVKDEKLYFKLIKAGFMHRRKTFLNSIKISGGFDVFKIEKILEEEGIDLRIRPERLTNLDYMNISNKYNN